MSLSAMHWWNIYQKNPILDKIVYIVLYQDSCVHVHAHFNQYAGVQDKFPSAEILANLLI